MRVLITNDDGFNSEGIKLLKKIAQKFASEIWVIAPDIDRSGAARSLDYPAKGSIKIMQPDINNKREFSISGTPADCVIIALNKLMDKKPDLILSGINIGSNVGDDVCYSGTIGAAMEGAARSIPSIALSQVYNRPLSKPIYDQKFLGEVQASTAEYSNVFEERSSASTTKLPLEIEFRKGSNGEVSWINAETWAEKIIGKLLEISWSKNAVMSVNFPATEKVKGIEFVEQGIYDIDGDLTFTDNQDNSLSLNWSREHSGSGSVGKIKEGFITITPIKLDFTDYDILSTMKNSHADKFSSILDICHKEQ